jgi:glutathione S-transferase
VYFPPIIRLMSLQETPADPAAVAARDTAARYYDEMETAVRDREFLAGAYSYADIAFYMAQLFGARMGAPMTDAHPSLAQWRDRMTARPAVRQVVAAMAAFLVSQGRPLPDFMAAVR